MKTDNVKLKFPKKFAILSSDNNPDYYSLLPFSCMGWLKLGYTPIVIFYGDVPSVADKYLSEAIICNQGSERFKGVRDSTASQVGRLFVTSMLPFEDDDVIITGDADMIVMKDIFTQEAPIVSYGYDLTGRSEIPICYVKATAKEWKKLMGGEMVMPQNAYSDDWNKYWGVDQQMLTEAAKKYGMEWITFVDRGNDQSNHGLPIGRWDRYKWENIPEDIIDVHVIKNPINHWDEIQKMAVRLFPDAELNWMEPFYKELLKQL